MKRRSEVPFIVICVVFSAVMLVMSMYGSAELAALNEDISGLRESVEAQKDINRRLAVDAELKVNLEEIDRYAREELGMTVPSPNQIIYIDFHQTDDVG